MTNDTTWLTSSPKKVGVGLHGSDFVNNRHCSTTKIHDPRTDTTHTHRGQTKPTGRIENHEKSPRRRRREHGNTPTETNNTSKNGAPTTPFLTPETCRLSLFARASQLRPKWEESLQRSTWPNKEGAKTCTLGQKQIRRVCTES